MELPETLPVLFEKQIHQGNFMFSHVCRCLAGWIMFACNVNHSQLTKHPLYHQILAAIHAKHGKKYQLICHFNDNEPPSVVVKLWNETIPTLGYEQQGDQFKRKEAQCQAAS